MITVAIKKATMCPGDISIYLSFPYDNRILEVVRSFPQRSWDKENKTWELPVKRLPELLSTLPNDEFEITGADLLTELAATKTTNLPKGFSFVTTPFQHQLEGVQYGLQNSAWLLGDEQGLGKTKQAIDIALAKRVVEGYNHCLIVCGVNGLKWNWMNEIRTHGKEEGYILGTRKNGIGSNADKKEDVQRLLLNVNAIPNYFLITNIETLRDEGITSGLAELCKHGDINMVVVDEIHKCKNPQSQQGKGILKLQPKYRLAMTGTPLMNQPLDLYVILKWLGYEKHTFYSFKNHFCEMGGFGGYEVVGYKNLSELRAQLEDIMLRRKKEDVLDLPAKLYVDEYVEMTPKQKQIYKEIHQAIKMNIDQIKVASNPLAELIRMRQATGYTGILSSTVEESAKLDRMEELVEEAVENGKQVVIFSNWTQMTDVVYARLHKKYAVAVITGQTKDADRQANVNQFQAGKSQVIIGTIGAMGTGITLTAGTVEIFLDEPWNRANKEQAEDRCHRVGTTENVTIYTLLCKDTIDERIHELVYEKGAMADALVDGKIAKDKSQVLDFLLS